MSVRFQCGFCAQPIEVDEEWASKTVACPYCRKTITAPAESTLGALDDIPTAVPLAGVGGAQETPVAASGAGQAFEPAGEVGTYPGPPYAPAPFGAAGSVYPPRNVVAVVGLYLACAALVACVGFLVLFSQHATEVAGFVQPGGAPPEWMQQGMPPWFMTLGLLELATGALWVAALVCGIIGMRHTVRRSYAIASLVLVGLLPLVLCLGLGIGMAGTELGAGLL